jgi:tRNA threonylcarbamoyladenosine biosynthesis protein TsaB
MLLLATDTSGKHGSIALALCGPGERCEIIEVVPLQGGTFSAQLIPQVATLLSKHGFGKHDIGGFAVVSGPGSFTGLRVGLAAIKALAEILNKPIGSVSLLEAVAAAGDPNSRVLAALDAGRGEIYVGEYENGRLVDPPGESLVNREEFLRVATDRLVVSPDEVILETARSAGLRGQQVDPPRSDAVAHLAWKKILSGKTVSAEDLEANYIRRSDAEIFSNKRL